MEPYSAPSTQIPKVIVEVIQECKSGNFIRVSPNPNQDSGALIGTFQLSAWSWGVFLLMNDAPMSVIRCSASSLANKNIDNLIVYNQKHRRHGIIQVSKQNGFESFISSHQRVNFTATHTSFNQAQIALIRQLIPLNPRASIPQKPVQQQGTPTLRRMGNFVPPKEETIELLGSPFDIAKSAAVMEVQIINGKTVQPKAYPVPKPEIKSFVNGQITFEGCFQSQSPEVMKMYKRLSGWSSTEGKSETTKKKTLKQCDGMSMKIDSLGSKGTLEDNVIQIMASKSSNAMQLDQAENSACKLFNSGPCQISIHQFNQSVMV